MAAFERPAPDPALVMQLEAELERLRELEAKQAPAQEWRVPSTLSVTAFLTFVRDPDEFFRRYVRRVPAPPSPAAKLGTEVHRRIELHARGVAAVGGLPEDVEEPYDLDPGERTGGAAPVSAEQMWQNFQQSRFAQRKPLMVEQPFTLYLGEGISVQGRIDAIYEREDGTWEIVDFKTGKSDPDPLQLAIYARAVKEIWGRNAESSWLLLRTGAEQPAPAVEDLDGVLQRSITALSRLA